MKSNLMSLALLVYLGAEQISAAPMGLKDAEKHLDRNVGYKGDVPVNSDVCGYLVQYENGYQSWLPKDVFEKSYRPADGLSFGLALEALKKGLKVARRGWNGKNMWLILVGGTKSVRPVAGTPYSKAGITCEVNIESHIDMFNSQGNMQPGWLASQADMLADDWMILE